MEDILERRKKSYDGTHFAFLQKTGRFRNDCSWLLVGKVVKYNLYIKTPVESFAVENARRKEETS